jgi:hypothetical protein
MDEVKHVLPFSYEICSFRNRSFESRQMVVRYKPSVSHMSVSRLFRLAGGHLLQLLAVVTRNRSIFASAKLCAVYIMLLPAP